MERCEGKCSGCRPPIYVERPCCLGKGHPDTGEGCICYGCFRSYSLWAAESDKELMEELANEMEDALHALQNDDGVDIWATDSDLEQDAKEKEFFFRAVLVVW